MSISERELNQITLIRNTVTYTYELKNLLVSLAYTNNHVVNK